MSDPGCREPRFCTILPPTINGRDQCKMGNAMAMAFRASRRKMLRSLGISLLALIGCRTASVDQLAPPVNRIAVDPASVSAYQEGREIYVSRCAKCHGVKSVRAFAAEDWASRIMPAEAKKAKLTPEEKQSVLAYVLAAREPRSPMAF